MQKIQTEILSYCLIVEKKLFLLTRFIPFFVFKEKKAMEELENLILKSVYGTLTSAEQGTLNTWLTDAKNQKQYIRIRERLLQRDTIQFLAEVNTEKALRLSYRRRYRRLISMAATAVSAAIIFLLISLWPTGESEIFPAGEQIAMKHATITLASGEVLELNRDSLKHSSVAETIEVTDKDIHIKENVPSSSTGYNILRVPRGESYSIKLSDGTKVRVNALSELKFPSSFKEMKERVVELTGEGYFEVAHDTLHPFRVKTEMQLITVTGTMFNVSAYSGEVSRTTLCEGSVVVKTTTEETVRLLPGQQLSIPAAGGRPEIREVNTEFFTAWMNGEYYFDNQTLREVFNTLSKWYDIDEVQFVSIMDEQNLFSGKFRRSDRLETILQMIERGTNFSIEYVDKKVTVKMKE